MSDRNQSKPRRPHGEANAPDYAEQMARAAFGRHYLDTRRIEQVLKDGEVIFRHKPPAPRKGSS